MGPVGAGGPNYLQLQMVIASKLETVHLGGLIKSGAKLLFRNIVEDIWADRCSFYATWYLWDN